MTGTGERRGGRGGALDAYLRRVRDVVAEGLASADAIRSIGGALLRGAGVDAPEPFATAPSVAELVPPPHLATPSLLGHAHEAVLDAGTRRRRGAHYTPTAIAEGLVALARDGHVTAPRVCDPAVGGGAFLLATAQSLAADGLDPRAVIRDHCFGGDVDEVAVDVTRATLALWAGAWVDELAGNVVVADALVSSPWPADLDLVVGNPPFQGQLDRRTARTRAEAAALRDRLGEAATGYVDTAALFLLRGLELVRPGGRVALVQPHSTLGVRDAQRVRLFVDERARIVALWFTEEQVFRAGVRVWAPVVERRGVAADSVADGAAESAADSAADGTDGTVGTVDDADVGVRRRVGAAFEPAPPAPAVAAGEWTALVADLAGIPLATLRTSGCVGDLATATAGFRDEYYGLAAAVRERDAPRSGRGDGPALRLVTSGLVDVLDTSWGRVAARFANRRWDAPVVDRDALDERVARWVTAQLRPKLVLATQTKVVEVAVDERGDLVPCTPVIAVHAAREHLWLLAAALASPPVTALARLRTYGSGMSASSIKLSARQVRTLPLPADHDAWEEAARRARAVVGTTGPTRVEALRSFAEAGCAAYGVHPRELVPWWLARVTGDAPGHGNG